MKAFIQHKTDSAYSIAAILAAEGFRQRGFELVPFTVEEIDTIAWKREDVVVGGVGTSKRIFEKLQIPWAPNTYPKMLRPFLKREVSVKTLGEIGQEHLPLFLKPKVDSKRFTGFVAFDRWDRRLGNLPGDFEVYAADRIEITTEYRVYVLDHKILNIARYTGPADCFPNAKTIRGMITAYFDAPISYSLDVGVLADGTTALIETNEPLSLGNYGLSPVLASKMLSARWNQIVGLPYHEDAETWDSPSFISAY